MINPITFKISVAHNKQAAQSSQGFTPNPLCQRADTVLANYNQVLVKPKIDKDSAEVMNNVAYLNSITPMRFRLPQSFKIDEINGESFYNPDGTLAFISEYREDSIRNFYPAKEVKDARISVEMIEELDKETGRMIAKYEPAVRKEGTLKTNITVFDEKQNNKYILFQTEEDGLVESTTEFSGEGKSFRALMRNPDTTVPVRYMEMKENEAGELSVISCKFDRAGKLTEIKRSTASGEVLIQYDGETKTVKKVDR